MSLSAQQFTSFFVHHQFKPFKLHFREKEQIDKTRQGLTKASPLSNLICLWEMSCYVKSTLKDSVLSARSIQGKGAKQQIMSEHYGQELTKVGPLLNFNGPLEVSCSIKSTLKGEGQQMKVILTSNLNSDVMPQSPTPTQNL